MLIIMVSTKNIITIFLLSLSFFNVVRVYIMSNANEITDPVLNPYTYTFV